MIVIGEKINGSIPVVAEAISKRDALFIRERARTQAAAGATFIDCCASVPREQEAETLKWLIGCIQEAVDLPIALDSPSADVLTEVYQFCRRPGLFNSISGEGDKSDKIFSLMAMPENRQWEVIALLSDDTGIPKCAGDRMRVLDRIMTKAEAYDIAPNRIHIDPLVEMLCTCEDGISMILDVIHSVKAKYPSIHVTGAVSNISFNLPARRLLNQTFLVLAMSAGMDSAVMDPTNRDLTGIMYAAEAMLGRDEYCLEYIEAYRDGKFGPVK